MTKAKDKEKEAEAKAPAEKPATPTPAFSQTSGNRSVAMAASPGEPGWPEHKNKALEEARARETETKETPPDREGDPNARLTGEE